MKYINRRFMITSIGAGFLSRLFSSQSKVINKLSKWKKKKNNWLERSLDRKPAPIEVIMKTGYKYRPIIPVNDRKGIVSYSCDRVKNKRIVLSLIKRFVYNTLSRKLSQKLRKHLRPGAQPGFC